jgi:hypothetical protein
MFQPRALTPTSGSPVPLPIVGDACQLCFVWE